MRSPFLNVGIQAGNIHVEGMIGNKIVIIDNIVSNGNIKAIKNTIPRNLLIISNTINNGDIQVEKNQKGFIGINSNTLDNGNFQVNKNSEMRFGIWFNTLSGNLQCFENSLAPVGGSNTVDGNKDGQCTGL